MLLWEQGRVVSSRKAALVNHPTLHLLWCVNLEAALPHQKRLLTHFLPCEMLQRSRVVQESVLRCLLPAGGQLDWVCWQSGKIPAGHLPGAVPAWETPQHCQPGCWPCLLLPEAGDAAGAVSHLPPLRVAPQGASSAVVTKSSLLGTLHIYGLGIPGTETGRWRRFMRAEIARACFVRVRF